MKQIFLLEVYFITNMIIFIYHIHNQNIFCIIILFILLNNDKCYDDNKKNLAFLNASLDSNISKLNCDFAGENYHITKVAKNVFKDGFAFSSLT